MARISSDPIFAGIPQGFCGIPSFARKSLVLKDQRED